MWYALFSERRPALALEIGVYRGQLFSLWALIRSKLGIQLEVHGISPFSPAGDGVSAYLALASYYDDVLSHFARFNLPSPHLHRGYSTSAEMLQVIGQHAWDLIYVDGSHDYEVVAQDANSSGNAIRVGGLMVLDDSALFSGYRPPRFSTKGHPGPSRVADDLDRNRFRELLSVGHNRVFERIK